jgi:hypothetical protein
MHAVTLLDYKWAAPLLRPLAIHAKEIASFGIRATLKRAVSPRKRRYRTIEDGAIRGIGRTFEARALASRSINHLPLSTGADEFSCTCVRIIALEGPRHQVGLQHVRECACLRLKPEPDFGYTRPLAAVI